MTRADETVAAQVEALQRELSGSIVPNAQTDEEPGFDLEDVKNANYPNRPKSNSRRRGLRGFARFLVAICIGVAGTLAWQSYGDAAKQVIATRASELGWSPQTKQMIASWTAGWTEPPSNPEKTAPEIVALKAPLAPSIDPAQVQQIVQSLAALREIVTQIAASQDQTSRVMARVESAVAALIKTPEREPVPVAPSSSPTAPQSSRTPTPRH